MISGPSGLPWCCGGPYPTLDGKKGVEKQMCFSNCRATRDREVDKIYKYINGEFHRRAVWD